MQRVAPGQLSFDAAPKGRKRPDIASVSLSGRFGSGAIVSDDGGFPQLSHGEVMLVIVQDADGNMVAQGQGVVSIAFADKSVTYMPSLYKPAKVAATMARRHGSMHGHGHVWGPVIGGA